jgi:hypothetical protein
MGVPDGAHTHGHGGGSGIGAAVLALVVVALAVKVLPVAVDAAAELVRLALIAVAVLAGLAVAGGVALAAFHVHRWRTRGTTRVSLPAPTAQRAVEAPREPRPALEAPRQVHLHFHGTDPAEVAAIIRSQQEDQ